MANGLLDSEWAASQQKVLDTQKDLFFATLVHDLKNPVQAQCISLKMLLNGTLGDLKGEQKEIINMIIESNNYMQNLIQSILGVYKLNNDSVSLNRKMFNVVDLVNICVNEIRACAFDKNMNINIDFENDGMTLYADDIQIRRVISNLLNNAIKYSFNGSCLKISVKNNGSSTVFCFENSGPEIQQEIKERLFEKFISGNKDSRFSGVGLGLYYSKKVVEAHNGKIYFEGYGTCNKFIFEIPNYFLEKDEFISLD